MDIDVALVPDQARQWRRTVCVVIDEIRASSTITVLLDLGCTSLYLTAGLQHARRLARETGSLLAGERHGLTPRGFDFNNSPSELSRAGIRGRSVVLCTMNGTNVLSRLRHMPAALVGCILNASASAEAAIDLAVTLDANLGVICAGQQGAFALDDAIAAGVIVDAMVDALQIRGDRPCLTDAARAARRLRASYPSVMAAFRDSDAWQVLHDIGAPEDLELCARIDTTRTVGILRDGPALRIERLGGA
jgi:2-phosphosulfolactate phosphatase